MPCASLNPPFCGGIAAAATAPGLTHHQAHAAVDTGWNR